MIVTSAQEQIELLRQVLELARSQRDAAERDDLDVFDALMVRREALLRGIGLTDAASAAASLLHDVALTNDEAVTLDALVRQILEQDQANEALLGGLMTSIRDEMPGLAKGQEANAAYRMSERPSTFINRVS